MFSFHVHKMNNFLITSFPFNSQINLAVLGLKKEQHLRFTKALTSELT